MIFKFIIIQMQGGNIKKEYFRDYSLEIQKINYEEIKNTKKFSPINCFFIMFSILIVRLFQLQIVKGQEYENNFILQTKREIVLSGARGNIYDRNGKPLATNKLANSVTFEDQETYNSDRERQLNLNSKIYQMIRIIKSKGDSIETSLKIIIDPNGNFQFSVDDFWLQRFKADVYGKANIDDMEAKERNSTADEIVSYLSDKFCVFAQGEKKYTDKEKKDYGLPQQFEKSDLLDILNIRYALSLQAYQKYLSVTVAKMYQMKLLLPLWKINMIFQELILNRIQYECMKEEKRVPLY